MNKNETYFVFDVESVGLHGEGFAVGWVIVSKDGLTFEQGCAACPPENARGSEADRAWIKGNIPTLLTHYKTPKEIRSEFWFVWTRWKSDALMFADCAWPVEARFLAQCVEDDPDNRTWEGPYPLHDIATVLFCNGVDPLLTFDRLPNELPKHDPLNDARQSARILIERLNKI